MTTRDLALHRADLMLALDAEGKPVELHHALRLVREMREALADYEADAIHTCGPDCKRPMCELREELAALRAQEPVEWKVESAGGGTTRRFSTYTHVQNYLDLGWAATALYAAPAPAAVPDGYVLVPKEPTRRMKYDGSRAIGGTCVDVYEAMLAATQKQTTNATTKASEDRSYLRPAVVQFAHRMEDVLRKNDHKGGWERLDQGWLYVRLLEEARELEAAIRHGGNRNTKHDAAILVANEAADVANFAMMIASNAMLAAAQSAAQEGK